MRRMRFPHTKNTGKAGWQDRVNAVLVSLAKTRQCITYADLADLADIPAPQRIHKLTQHLEGLVGRDAKNNAPLLAAVVVSKRGTGLPGEGFFECCTAHGITQKRGESLAGFHQRLLTAVFVAFADDEADGITSHG